MRATTRSPSIPPLPTHPISVRLLLSPTQPPVLSLEGICKGIVSLAFLHLFPVPLDTLTRVTHSFQANEHQIKLIGNFDEELITLYPSDESRATSLVNVLSTPPAGSVFILAAGSSWRIITYLPATTTLASARDYILPRVHTVFSFVKGNSRVKREDEEALTLKALAHKIRRKLTGSFAPPPIISNTDAFVVLEQSEHQQIQPHATVPERTNLPHPPPGFVPSLPQESLPVVIRGTMWTQRSKAIQVQGKSLDQLRPQIDQWLRSVGFEQPVFRFVVRGKLLPVRLEASRSFASAVPVLPPNANATFPGLISLPHPTHPGKLLFYPAIQIQLSRNSWSTNSWEALLSACNPLKIDDIRSILQQQPSLAQWTDEMGRNCLHWLCESAHLQHDFPPILLTELLVDADVNGADWQGKTPLMIASQRGPSELVNGLIQMGASVNATDACGRSAAHHSAYAAAHHSAYANQYGIYLLLKRSGCSDSEDIWGHTPSLLWLSHHQKILTTALSAKKDDALIDLLQRQPDLPYHYSAYAPPLHSFILQCGIGVIKWLCSDDCPVPVDVLREKDWRKSTALHISCSLGLTEAAILLCKSRLGLNPCDRNISGRNAFEEALYRGHKDTFTQLAQAIGWEQICCDGQDSLGFSLHDHIKINGLDIETALEEGNVKQVDLCLKYPSCHPQSVEPDAMVNAAHRGQIDIIQMLVSNGLKLLVKDSSGFNPLTAAIDKGHMDLIEWIVKNEPKTLRAVTKSGKSSLHVAASSRCKHWPSVMQQLIGLMGKDDLIKAIGTYDANEMNVLHELIGRDAMPLLDVFGSTGSAVADDSIGDGVQLVLRIVEIAGVDVLRKGRPPPKGCQYRKKMKIQKESSGGGETLLHTAIRARISGNAVMALIAAGSCVGDVDWEGISALHLAVKQGSSEMAAILINSGDADSLRTLFSPRSSIWHTIAYSHLDASTIDLLLSVGGVEAAAYSLAVPSGPCKLAMKDAGNASAEECTPIEVAAAVGNVPVVTSLLAAGVNVDESIVLLSLKVRHPNMAVVERLSEKCGISSNVLELAMKKASTDLAIGLLDRSSDCESRVLEGALLRNASTVAFHILNLPHSDWSVKSLLLACDDGNEEVIKLMLHNESKFDNVRDGIQSLYLAQCMVLCVQKGWVDFAVQMVNVIGLPSTGLIPANIYQQSRIGHMLKQRISNTSDYPSPLKEAVVRGDTNALITLLQHGVRVQDVHTQDWYNLYPSASLIDEALSSDEEQLAPLLSRRTLILKQLALCQGELDDVIKKLMYTIASRSSAISDVSWFFSNFSTHAPHWSAVEAATAAGNTETVAYLIKQGATPPKDGGTVYRHGHIPYLHIPAKVLARSVSYQSEQGWTPLHEACYKHNPSLVEALLSAGCPLSSPNWTISPFQALLLNVPWQPNASRNVKDAVLFERVAAIADTLIGLTHPELLAVSIPAWAVAIQKGCWSFAESILKRCDESATGEAWWWVRTALLRCIKYAPNVAIIRDLFRYAGQLSQSLMSVCSEPKNASTASNDADEFLKTASLLHVAAWYNRLDAVECLLDLSAPSSQSCPVPHRSQGWTPLHTAASTASPEVIRLIASASDLHSPSAEGHTPLYLACRSGHYKAVEMLLSMGAVVDSTCPSAAIQGGCDEMACEMISNCIGSTEWYQPQLIVDAAAKDMQKTVMQLVSQHPEMTGEACYSSALFGHPTPLLDRVVDKESIWNAKAQYKVLDGLMKMEGFGTVFGRWEFPLPGVLPSKGDLHVKRYCAVLSASAAKAGHLPLLHLLHKKGVGIHPACMHQAARSGNLEVVLFLADECGVDVTNTDPQKRTAAVLAALSGHDLVAIELIRREALLFSDGPCPSEQWASRSGESLTHVAASRGLSRLVQWLVQRPTNCFINKSQKANPQVTPTALAWMMGHTGLVAQMEALTGSETDLLKDMRFSDLLDSVSTFNPWSSLIKKLEDSTSTQPLAHWNRSSWDALNTGQTAKVLAQVTQQSPPVLYLSLTSLHHAAMINCRTGVELLANSPNVTLLTPLMAAAACGNHEACNLLMKDAKLTIQPGRLHPHPLLGSEPVGAASLAAAAGHLDLASVLVTAGAVGPGGVSPVICLACIQTVDNNDSHIAESIASMLDKCMNPHHPSLALAFEAASCRGLVNSLGVLTSRLKAPPGFSMTCHMLEQLTLLKKASPAFCPTQPIPASAPRLSTTQWIAILKTNTFYDPASTSLEDALSHQLNLAQQALGQLAIQGKTAPVQLQLDVESFIRHPSRLSSMALSSMVGSLLLSDIISVVIDVWERNAAKGLAQWMPGGFKIELGDVPDAQIQSSPPVLCITAVLREDELQLQIPDIKATVARIAHVEEMEVQSSVEKWVLPSILHRLAKMKWAPAELANPITIDWESVSRAVKRRKEEPFSYSCGLWHLDWSSVAPTILSAGFSVAAAIHASRGVANPPSLQKRLLLSWDLPHPLDDPVADDSVVVLFVGRDAIPVEYQLLPPNAVEGASLQPLMAETIVVDLNAFEVRMDESVSSCSGLVRRWKCQDGWSRLNALLQALKNLKTKPISLVFPDQQVEESLVMPPKGPFQGLADLDSRLMDASFDGKQLILTVNTIAGALPIQFHSGLTALSSREMAFLADEIARAMQRDAKG